MNYFTTFLMAAYVICHQPVTYASAVALGKSVGPCVRDIHVEQVL